MEFKDPQELYRAIDKMDSDRPPVIIISGSDPDISDKAIERISQKLKKDGEDSPELYRFSGEPGDDEQFLRECLNMPLFSPYRIFFLRKAKEIFAGPLFKDAGQKKLREDFKHIPDRTIIVVDYEGPAPAAIVKLFEGNHLHLVTREIYPNQLADSIRNIALQHGIHLNEDTLHEIRERVEPRTGAIISTMERLRDLLLPEREGKPTVQDIREILSQRIGWDIMTVVDSIFAGNELETHVQLKSFNEAEDHFFPLLKLMLMRTDEIRKYKMASSMGMNSDEIMAFLGLKGRHPFIQKKILQRLSIEKNRFSGEHIGRIYDMLIKLQKDFRSNVSVHQHRMIFEVRINDLFFSHQA